MNYGRKTILFVAISAGLLCGCSKSEKPLAAYDAQYLDYFDTITVSRLMPKVKRNLKNIRVWQKILWKNIMSCLTFMITMMA